MQRFVCDVDSVTYFPQKVVSFGTVKSKSIISSSDCQSHQNFQNWRLKLQTEKLLCLK